MVVLSEKRNSFYYTRGQDSGPGQMMGLFHLSPSGTYVVRRASLGACDTVPAA